MDMVHLSPLGLASQDGCIFRDKGKETNAISAFSKLPINDLHAAAMDQTETVIDPCDHLLLFKVQ